MGLASAMSTALTGMHASQTDINVLGNNLANADTVGFKESNSNFVTQFLQTLDEPLLIHLLLGSRIDHDFFL